MKKLCFGSYASVLSKCKAKRISQKKLISTMLLSVNPIYDISGDDVAVSALVRGKNNLSDEVTLFLDDEAAVLPSKFRESVLPLLDANKKGNIVLAVKEILKEDTDIADDTEVEMVNHITKADLLNRDSFVFVDLLVGLFLYVAKYTDNHDKKQYIEEITDTFISQFDACRDSITFIQSYSIQGEGEIKTVAADAHIMELMAEAEGVCPMCCKTLARDNCMIVPLGNGSDMLLCYACGAEVQHSPTEQTSAQILKNNLQTRSQMRDAITANRLVSDVREVLTNIGSMPTENITLRKTPLSIEKKVSDSLLRRRIRGYIIDGMYDAVNACIEGLAAENRINVTKLSKCIRRLFEDASAETQVQSEIFNGLANYLFVHNGQKQYEACELLVSYFVQRCEVFNEITE